MSDNLQATITVVIARAPEWVRQELLSKEPATRAPAEEALGAMIAGALNGSAHVKGEVPADAMSLRRIVDRWESCDRAASE